jgi:hypothetical protein
VHTIIVSALSEISVSKMFSRDTETLAFPRILSFFDRNTIPLATPKRSAEPCNSPERSTMKWALLSCGTWLGTFVDKNGTWRSDRLASSRPEADDGGTCFRSPFLKNISIGDETSIVSPPVLRTAETSSSRTKEAEIARLMFPMTTVVSVVLLREEE